MPINSNSEIYSYGAYNFIMWILYAVLGQKRSDVLVATQGVDRGVGEGFQSCFVDFPNWMSDVFQ